MWSARNVGLIGILQAENRMRERGDREVANAKADGRWAVAYANTGATRIPKELAEALSAHEGAESFFVDAGRHEQYAAVHWVKMASSPQLKSQRANRIAQLAAANESWLHAETGHALF